ncbi:MAG: PAS domain S-box protein, partial [Bacteroidota bacterium]|nr:PAS domain S-box protein [Bacteroidota bacterium]
MNSNLDPTYIELESKIQILEIENETLSAKAEENLLLNRAFEEIDVYDDIDKLFLSTLESISVLLNIQFSGLFDIVDNQFICKSSYALFSNEETVNIQLKVQEPILKRLILNETCFFSKPDSGFTFNYPDSDFKAEQVLLIPLHSEFIKNRYFVFINDSSQQDLAERKQLFEKIIRIISTKLERIYFQNELKILNEELEKKFAIRTVELQNRNIELEMAILRAEQSELQAKDILQTAMDGFWLVDMQGRFIEINEIACTMLGYSREEMLDMSISDVEVNETPEQTISHLKQVKKIGQSKFESRHRCKNGRIIDVEISVKTQPHQQLNVAFISDITERKKAEKALLESDDRFRLAMKASNDGLFDWNLETNQIYYSPGWKKMLGYEDHELPNDFSVWETTTNPEDVKASWELQQKLINKEVDRFVLEFKMKHKHGHWVDILSRAEAFFNDNGKAIRIVGTHTDMTDRNKAEKEIVEINEMFSQYIKHSPIFTYIKDVTPERSVVLQASDNFIDMIGISGNNMIGKSMEELFPPEFASKITSDDWEVTSGNMVLKLDEELNGKYYSTIKFPFKKGDKTLLAGYTIDITDNKKAQMEIQETESRWRRAIADSPVPIMIHDEDDQVLQLSKGWTKYSGYT